MKIPIKIIGAAAALTFLLPLAAMAKQNNIAGTVSSIDPGNYTIIFNTKKGEAYTAEAVNADITQGKTKIDLGQIQVGDNIAVLGVITGNNIVASTIKKIVAKSAPIKKTAIKKTLSPPKNTGKMIKNKTKKIIKPVKTKKSTTK